MRVGEVFFGMAQKKQLPDFWYFGRGVRSHLAEPKDGLAQKYTSRETIHSGGSKLAVDDMLPKKPGAKNGNPA